MESGRIKAPHKHARAKNSVSKIIQKSPFELKPGDSSVVAYLNKQGGIHSGNLCPNLENRGLDKCQGDSDLGKTHPRESQGSSRFLVQKRNGDSNLMGFESSFLLR